jgi:hypothetical protein
LLNLKPGDRLFSNVKSLDSRGLICSTTNNIDFRVYHHQYLNNPHPNQTQPLTPQVMSRPIPDSLWRVGAFATLAFAGVSPKDGPYATIAPESMSDNSHTEALGSLPLPDEVQFELDANLKAMLSNNPTNLSSSSSSPSSGSRVIRVRSRSRIKKP